MAARIRPIVANRQSSDTLKRSWAIDLDNTSSIGRTFLTGNVASRRCTFCRADAATCIGSPIVRMTKFVATNCFNRTLSASGTCAKGTNTVGGAGVLRLDCLVSLTTPTTLRIAESPNPQPTHNCCPRGLTLEKFWWAKASFTTTTAADPGV